MCGRKSIPVHIRLAKHSELVASGCIEWQGWRVNSGYGVIRLGPLKEGRDLAHRVAYRLAYGEIPVGMQVMHKCDNKICVNPDHLSAGTCLDNMCDMVSKGRQRKSRLSADDVADMHIMFSRGELQKEIAAKYGVSRPYVSELLTGKASCIARL